MCYYTNNNCNQEGTHYQVKEIAGAVTSSEVTEDDTSRTKDILMGKMTEASYKKPDCPY